MKHWKRNLILVGIAALGIYYSDWYFTRWAHYKFSYEALVKSEIRHSVKQECLREP